jgi:Uma2 family endonuclease
VAKVTKKPPNVLAVELIRDELLRLVSRAHWRVMVEAPVRIPEFDEPEPDVAVARGTTKDYANRHPGHADLAMVVEVSESSVAEDRKLARVYGPAGIPVYWIVNLQARQVELYTLNRRGGYGKPRIFRSGQSVPVVIEGAEVGRIAVDDIMPPLATAAEENEV